VSAFLSTNWFFVSGLARSHDSGPFLISGHARIMGTQKKLTLDDQERAVESYLLLTVAGWISSTSTQFVG
jgi:hypothetical protein